MQTETKESCVDYPNIRQKNIQDKNLLSKTKNDTSLLKSQNIEKTEQL